MREYVRGGCRLVVLSRAHAPIQYRTAQNDGAPILMIQGFF